MTKWAAVDAIRSTVALSAPPKGAFTAYDYADNYSIPHPTGVSQLHALVRAGKLKTELFNVKVGGRTRSVRYFWV